MIPLYDVLSLWELCHRWHGYHPDETNPDALPMEVIDTLRLLTRALYQHDLSISEKGGVEFGNARTTVSLEGFIPSWEHDNSEDKHSPSGPPDGVDPEVAKWNEYSAHRETRTKHHNEMVKDFPRCFEQRRFDKSLLENRYVTYHSFERFCNDENIPFPGFWTLLTNTSEETETKTKALRNDQLDKQLVQAIAKTLWIEHPKITISGLIRHKATLQHGNGNQYAKKTLRKWISEVDPRPKEEKVGRPKNNNPDNTGS